MNAKTNSSDIERRLKEIISKLLRIDINQIKEDSSIEKDFGASSIDLIQLMSALENEFELEIEDEDIEKLVSFKDAVAYLETCIN